MSHHSSSSYLASKRADAAAELAAKEAEYRVVQEERKQKERMKALEEQHKKEMESQKSELERIQAEKEVKAARARLEAYNRELAQTGEVQVIRSEKVSPSSTPQSPTSSPPDSPTLPEPSSVAQLAQVVQDSMIINRLPIPEPTVFSGEPMLFIEWKSSMSLIDQQGISAANKLFYLKKYVSGPARKCLEGTFFRNDEEAYKDAWDKLNQRYGQAFVIQRAFRDKLANWPRIPSKDAEGLRNFADFINACTLAIPHVKGPRNIK